MGTVSKASPTTGYRQHLPDILHLSSEHSVTSSVLKNLRTERRASERRASEQPPSLAWVKNSTCLLATRSRHSKFRKDSLARSPLTRPSFSEHFIQNKDHNWCQKMKNQVFFGSDSVRSKQDQPNADFPTRFHLKIMKETITNDSFMMTKSERTLFVNI